jgi:hypothetical protein
MAKGQEKRLNAAVQIRKVGRDSDIEDERQKG